MDALCLLADGGIAIGESGVAGLAGLLAVATDSASREMVDVTADSRVLLFGTDGVTDPVVYNGILCSRQC